MAEYRRERRSGNRVQVVPRREVSHCLNCRADLSAHRSNAKCCSRKCQATWYSKTHPDKSQEWRNKSLYGLPKGGHIVILEEQGNACAICGDTSPAGQWHVDHDHTTGKVRGVLCRACNVGLSRFRDDPARLASAIEYLRRSHELQSA